MNATSSQLQGALIRAGQLLLQGELQQSAAACRSVLERAPDQPAATHLLGLAQARLGVPGEAEPLLRRSLSLEPANHEFRLNFGNFLRDCGRLSEAEAEYRQVLAQVPGARKARHQLALTLFDLGRRAEAETEARRTLGRS
jgi:Flp pilus assembly protein TadD